MYSQRNEKMNFLYFYEVSQFAKYGYPVKRW